MRDDTPTYAAEEAHAAAHAPEWARADLPEPDELDWPETPWLPAEPAAPIALKPAGPPWEPA